jgi:hypothetical protein
VGLCACVATACGGAQRGTLDLGGADAGADATETLTSVGPSDPDPCVTSQDFEYQVLTSFVAGDGIAGPYATYVSYDTTGLLYQDGIALTEQSVNAAECETGYTATSDPLSPARCGSDSTGLRLFATGGTFNAAGNGVPNDAGLTGWGMNVGTDLRQNCNMALLPNCSDAPSSNPPTGPSYFDATEWTGISFWAMLGPGSSGTSALVTVPDPNTAGVLGGTYPFNDLTCGNAACVAGQPMDMHCTAASVPLCLCDPFGKAIGLVDHWAFYAIPFSDMRQKGYGAPQPELDLAHVLGFKLSLGPGTWNVYIDNIAFYRPKGD